MKVNFPQVNKLAGIELTESAPAKKEETPSATPPVEGSLPTQDELLAVVHGMIEHLQEQGYEIPDDMTVRDLIQEMCDNPELRDEVEYLASYGLTDVEVDETEPPAPKELSQAFQVMAKTEWFQKVSGLAHLTEADVALDKTNAKAAAVASKIKAKFIPGPATTGDMEVATSPAGEPKTVRSHPVHHMLHKAGLGDYSDEEKKEFAKKDIALAEKHLKDAKAASDAAYKIHTAHVASGKANAKSYAKWRQASENHRAASELYLHARKQLHETAEFAAGVSELAIGLMENGYELPDNYTVQDLFRSIEQTPELAAIYGSEPYRQLVEYEKAMSNSPEGPLITLPVLGLLQDTVTSEFGLQNIFTLLNAWDEIRESVQIAEEDKGFAEEMDALGDLVAHLDEQGYEMGDYLTIPSLFELIDGTEELKELHDDPDYQQLREGILKKAGKALKHIGTGALAAAALAGGGLPVAAAGLGAHVVGHLIHQGHKAIKKMPAKEKHDPAKANHPQETEAQRKDAEAFARHKERLHKEMDAHHKRIEHHYSQIHKKAKALGIHQDDPMHQHLLPSHASSSSYPN